MMGIRPIAREMARTRSSNVHHEFYEVQNQKKAPYQYTIWRAHGRGGDTDDFLNSFAGPAKFSNNLFVSQRRQVLRQ